MNADQLLSQYYSVRTTTCNLCESLSAEDQVVQSMPDASPTKWHLAHTSWFFETFVIQAVKGQSTCFHPAFAHLFNSYYHSVGTRHPRSQRGLLTRPCLADVFRYRRYVDEQIEQILTASAKEQRASQELLDRLELGLHHEQQHQELILTDIKHLLSNNPLRPAYCECIKLPPDSLTNLDWLKVPEGIYTVGHQRDGFCFDNELPAHQVILRPFALASRLITNQEYMEFIDDGGYRRSELWLSDGWEHIQREGWQVPLYGDVTERELFTLSGQRPIVASEPVCHVSFYEADAYARWAKARLPTEQEWEVAAEQRASELWQRTNFAEDRHFHPVAVGPHESLSQMLGDVWEWTASPYLAYPGYQAPVGALGEYNGKFMCNQFVLRGGSCATPRSHIRTTYRNFFPPHARWQFSGIRLARSL